MIQKRKRPRIDPGRGGESWQVSGVLTPSPSRATRPVTAINCGAEHLIREAVSDEDHFAIVDLSESAITL